MKFKQLTPNLMVEDVSQTITFYQDTLGFTLLATVPDSGPFDWAMLKRGEVTLMFQAKASLSDEIPALAGREIGGSLSFYIDVTDVKSLYEELQPKVRLAQPLHTTFYGREEFAIIDLNGYILAFAAEVSA
jgi:uncharacterized glyoxalase superfamily protein PhnB